MKIGMRTIKTALSVAISIFILGLVGITPIFATIAAIITMETDVPTSYKAGLSRILGTLVGAAIGALFVILSSYLPMENLFIESLVISVGLIIVIHTLSLLEMNKSIVSAGIVYLLLMIQIEGPLLGYIMTRILTTVLGVVIALVVNRFVLPNGFKSLKKQRN